MSDPQQHTVHHRLAVLAGAAVGTGVLLAWHDSVLGYSVVLGAAIGLLPQWWAAWRWLRPAPLGSALGVYRIEVGKWLFTIAVATIAFSIEPLAPWPLFAALVAALFGSIACVALAAPLK